MSKIKRLITATLLLLAMLIFVTYLDTQEQTSTADIQSAQMQAQINKDSRR